MRYFYIIKCMLILGVFLTPFVGYSFDNTQPSLTQKVEEYVLKGQVIGEDNRPIPGVSVVVVGTTKATSTNNDGKFIIEVDNPNDSIRVSFIGYLTQTVKLNGAKTLKIVLKEDAAGNKLNDVVIVGYGTQKKISVTGAISTITATEIEKVSTPSLSNAIAGKLPGLISRQGSGEPGSDGAGLVIRGLGTWVNRNPLILIDGIERDLNNISPQEIESFSILKDAASTAVYGVRGANGVILINTKQGKRGTPKITLRNEFASLTNLREREYIDGFQYASLMNEGLANVNKAPRWTPDELEKFKTGSDPYLYPNVDWINTVFKPTTFQSINNLSINGGGEIIRYFTNVGYTIQDGIYKTDNLNNFNTNAKLKRYNFRSNVDITLAKSLIANLSLGGIIDQKNNPGAGSGGIFGGATNTSPISFPVQNPDGSQGGSPVYAGSNPWAQATQTGYSSEKRNTLQGTFGLNWDLSKLVTKGLSIRGKFAYDNYTLNVAQRYKTFGIKQYLGKDAITGEDKYALVREAQPLGYNISQAANQALYTEGLINYDRTFGNHEFSGLFLYNQRDYTDLTAGSSILNLPYRRQGLAARASYSYKSKYLLELNAGYNGSENFPKGKRFGFFPSVSAGWVITKEDFWKAEAVSSLKIRGSYGQVGNDQIGGSRFLFLTTVNRNNQGYYFGDNQTLWNGMTESQTGVSDVTWEVSTKANLGIDLEMFKSKLVLQADFFHEDRKGILIKRGTIPAITGFFSESIPYGNLGRVKNKGVDAMLTFKNTSASGFYYSFNGNFTFAKNKVIENDEPPQLYDYLSGKGQPIDQPWGFVSAGFFESAQDIATWSDQTSLGGTPLVGDIKYKDINGDGKIDNYDQVPIGYSRTPNIMFGFGSTLAYKGFDFSLFFMGATKSSIFTEGRNFYPFAEGTGVFNIFKEYYDNRWTPATAATAKYPTVTDGNNAISFRRSTVWQKDASYLRLRNAEIGYTIPSSFMRKVKINKARVFVSGTNLYTWDTIKVIDPESDNGYPLQMILNAGLQVTF